MTYEELLIDIDLKGYKNVLPFVGKACLSNSHWFVVCNDGDCHLFDRYGKEDDISKVKEINEDMISKDIKKIVIPDNAMSINNMAFYNCNELMSVTIGNNVISIGDCAFFGCSSLTSVTILDSVERIGEYAFYDCSMLASITIPDSVIIIGKHVFKWCSDLNQIIFEGKSFKQLKSMNNYPFGIEDKSIIKCN